MNAAADRLEDSFPHGTVDGYRQGCHGAICPAGADHGLSCRRAKQLAAGDYRYQKLTKRGLTPADIAFELGLIPEPAAAPAAKPKNPAPAPTNAAQPLAESSNDRTDTSTPAVQPDAPSPGPTQGLDDAGRREEMGHPLRLSDFTVGLTAAGRYQRGREIRDWCRANGWGLLAHKGIIPQDALAAYALAHPAEALTGAAHELVHGHHTPTPGDAPAPIADLDFAHRSDLLDETRERVNAPTPRPEWATVTISEDVTNARAERDRARTTAVRLEQELAHAARTAGAALDFVLRAWAAERDRRALLEVELTASRHLVDATRRRFDAAEAERLSADRVLRAVLEALGAGPHADPVIKALDLVDELTRTRAGIERAAASSRSARRALRRAGLS